MSRARRAQLVVMSGASAAQAACNAVAALVATLTLGPGDRGLMVIGATIGSVCSLVGTLGVGPAFRLYLCVARGDDRPRIMSAFAWCSVAGAVFAAALAVVGTAASAPLIDAELAGPRFLLAVGAFATVQVLVQQVIQTWFADGRLRRGGLSAAAGGAGGLVGVLIASAVAATTAWMLLAQAIGTAVVVAVEIGALRRAALLRWARPSRCDVVALLRRGTPTLGLAIGLVLTLRADRYVLGLTTSAAAVGVYSLAATLSEIPRMVPTAIGQIYLRDVSLGLGGRNLARAIGAAVAAAAGGGLLVAVTGCLLVIPFFGAEFGGAKALVVVLVAAEVCFAPYAVASRGLLGGGWTTTAGVLGVVGAVGATACYVVSGGVAGTVGVAVGSVVVYAAFSGASWVLLRRRLRARTASTVLTRAD